MERHANWRVTLRVAPGDEYVRDVYAATQMNALGEVLHQLTRDRRHVNLSEIKHFHADFLEGAPDADQ